MRTAGPAGAVLDEPGFAVKAGLTPSEGRRVVENSEFAAFAARILRACARRVADGDVEGLAGLVALRSELDAAIADAVRGLRKPRWGYSWAEVARVLGMTRQAAQQRYGATADIETATGVRRGSQCTFDGW